MELEGRGQRECIAIIPARGGSKRIPGKNIRDFCGKPILAYSIKAALESGIFSEVMVSTDSEEIAEVARSHGAVVPFFRSEDMAGDFATVDNVVAEVLAQYADRGRSFKYASCIYPTAPFVTAERLRDALRMVKEEGFDCAMTVTSFSFPPLRGLVIKDDSLSYKWEEYRDCRSQDLETIYHDCGQFLLFRTDSFLRDGKMISGRTGAIIFPELEVQDIDNETDWKLAEMKYRLLNGEGNIAGR